MPPINYAKYQAANKQRKASSICQTTFRDSESQTDPWFPPYEVHAKVGAVPEVLTLTQFNWGNGLPFHRFDVLNLDRLRKRKAWEQLLIKGKFSLKLARDALTRLDLDDLHFAEEEIDREINERLKVAKQELKESRLNAENKRIAKMSLIRAKSENDLMDKKLITKKYLNRAIRMLNNRDRAIESQSNDNLMKKYLDKLSEVCFIPSRCSKDYRMKHEQIVVTMDDDYEILSKLDVNKKLKQSNGPYYTKRHACSTKYWPSYRYRKIEANQIQDKMYASPETSEEIVSCIPFQDMSQVELTNEVIFLQRLIRGRAQQTMMHLNRFKQLDNINMLRKMYGIEEESIYKVETKRRHKITLLRKYNFISKIVSVVLGVINQAQSGVISTILDFAHKELIRIKNERTVFNLVRSAHMARWGRESQEAGRRQKELMRRRQLQEYTRHLSKAHELYIEEVLLDLIDESVAAGAAKAAKELTEIKADEREPRFYEENIEAMEREMLIARMLFTHIIPEAENLPVRNQIEEKQENLRQHAYRIIFGQEEKDFEADETKSEKELRLFRVKTNEEIINNLDKAPTSLKMDQNQIDSFLENFLIEADERLKFAEEELKEHPSNFLLVSKSSTISSSNITDISLPETDDSKKTDSDD